MRLTLADVLAARAAAVNRLAWLGGSCATAVNPEMACDAANASVATIDLCNAWLAKNGHRAKSIGYL